MKLATRAFLVQAVAYSFASAYPITGDNVNCRSGPGTSYAIQRTYVKGYDVSITCQTQGTNINGNSIWDKTSDGCYVSDYYVKTGSNDYVADECIVCAAPAANQATVDLIAEFEGFVPNIYIDATGNPTVGYGHLCSNSNCSDVKYSIPLSEGDGKALLAQDMALFQNCITAMVNTNATLNLNQYGALVSWSFNVGCNAAQTSTLIRRLNSGESPQTVIPEELPKWVYGGGQVLPGLVRRREAEVALSNETTTDKALPAEC